MINIKKRFSIILIFNLVCTIGFILFRLFLNIYCQSIVDSNIGVLRFLKATWIFVFGIELYLLLIFIISFIGFLISKHHRKEEYRNAFKFQSIILFLLWVGFTIYCTVIQ